MGFRRGKKNFQNLEPKEQKQQKPTLTSTALKSTANSALQIPPPTIETILPIEPKGKPTPSQAAKSKVKPSLPTKAKHKPTEDAENSSRKMDNIGFIQNVEAYNAFISEHGTKPDGKTNKKLFTWHYNLCRAYRTRVGIVLTDERLSILRAAKINIIPLQTLDKELEPEISHSDDDRGLTFASTTGVTPIATINTTPFKVYVLGPCTLTRKEVGTGSVDSLLAGSKRRRRSEKKKPVDAQLNIGKSAKKKKTAVPIPILDFNAIQPLDKAPPLTSFPETGKCTWSYDNVTRVLLGKFKID
jgi:hypothetical protein